jgi:diaminohydroxyphosphoribosylaminopyrimidine deaminase / 5-amino-6-(5-phosphoribosylamino)uracil reductase
MRRAIELAAAHQTHPNPRVGAVVVDESGQVVGEGAHRGVGQPHAEVVALNQAGDRARGSTLHVTLEPCSHHGLMPPCAGAVVEAGVRTVVIGAIDPDPRVSGAGVSWLTDAGIEVETGLLEEEARALDPAYFHHRRTGLALVTMKLAMTLDGSVAASDGSSRWITSQEARNDAHSLRSVMDAVVVGAGTFRFDDPLLSARLEGVERQPVPVVVAGRQSLPIDRRIWERSPIVISVRPLGVPTGEVVVVGGKDEWPDPVESVRALSDRGLLDVLLEGGPQLAGSWWRAGVVGRGVTYIGPKVAGGRGMAPIEGDFATMALSRAVNIKDVRMVGPDIRIDFLPLEEGVPPQAGRGDS